MRNSGRDVLYLLMSKQSECYRSLMGNREKKWWSLCLLVIFVRT